MDRDPDIKDLRHVELAYYRGRKYYLYHFGGSLLYLWYNGPKTLF